VTDDSVCILTHVAAAVRSPSQIRADLARGIFRGPLLSFGLLVTLFSRELKPVKQVML
jgi:hypothetical protein